MKTVKSRKKILVVAENIDVENSSGSKGRVALIQSLHRAGFNVTVYHYTRKEIELQGISCVAIKENKHSLWFLLSRLERQLRYKLDLDLHESLERIFGFSFTLFNDRNSIVTALKKIKDLKPDLVLTLSQGSSFRPHHALLRLPALHDRWMAYIHDPYPMHSYPRPYDYVEAGHQKKRRFFLQVAAKARYAAYPSKMLADWMESYYPSLRDKAVVVPHQITKWQTKEVPLPDFFKQGQFTLVHAGTLLSARNPLALLKAFSQFLKENPEAKEHSQLLFLGESSKYSEYFSEYEKKTPQFYCSDGYLPFDTVLAIQQEAAINVILEAKGPVSPFLPGKFPHCIQARKPILLLGPYYSECRRLLGEDYAHWSEVNDDNKIKKIIEQLYSRWLRHKDLKMDRPDLESYLSEASLKETIETVLRE